jgi:hypothetical protein
MTDSKTGIFARIRLGIDAWFARQQEELDRKRASEARSAKFRAEMAANEAKGADGRLEEHFDRLNDGEISLAEYRDEIMQEQQDNREYREALRIDRPSMDRDDYDAERERLDEDREAIRWRLEWVNDKILDAKSRPDWLGKSGKWARFEYADDDGVVTKNNIVNWKAEGTNVVGYDRAQKVERLFEQNRISGWQAG